MSFSCKTRVRKIRSWVELLRVQIWESPHRRVPLRPYQIQTLQMRGTNMLSEWRGRSINTVKNGWNNGCRFECSGSIFWSPLQVSAAFSLFIQSVLGRNAASDMTRGGIFSMVLKHGLYMIKDILATVQTSPSQWDLRGIRSIPSRHLPVYR